MKRLLYLIPLFLIGCSPAKDSRFDAIVTFDNFVFQNDTHVTLATFQDGGSITEIETVSFTAIPGESERVLITVYGQDSDVLHFKVQQGYNLNTPANSFKYLILKNGNHFRSGWVQNNPSFHIP